MSESQSRGTKSHLPLVHVLVWVDNRWCQRLEGLKVGRMLSHAKCSANPTPSPAFLTDVSPCRGFSACPYAGTAESRAMAPLQHGIHGSAGNWELYRDKDRGDKGLFWQEQYLTAVKCTDLE